MTLNQLPVSSGSSSQTTTTSPQSVGSSTDDGSAQVGQSVQPGTAANLLNSQNGVQLSNLVLPTVDLNAAATPSMLSSSTPTGATKHHVNLTLLTVPGLFMIVAIVLFFVANRSIKSTT